MALFAHVPTLLYTAGTDSASPVDLARIFFGVLLWTALVILSRRSAGAPARSSELEVGAARNPRRHLEPAEGVREGPRVASGFMRSDRGDRAVALRARGFDRRLVMAAFVLALPGRLAASPVTRPAPEMKTLQREQAPVIVRTGLLTGLPDRETSHYRLYAVRHGSLEPIPFQFDARDADGEVILSEDGTETEFTFGDDDELVFMAKDTGDRAPNDLMPAIGDAALEFTVVDRARAGTAWAYLVHFPENPPPRSPIRYATFDPVRQEAHALTYEVGYSQDRSNFLRRVRIPAGAGGAGETLIEGLKMRISPTFSFLGATLSPTLTEQSFAVEPDGMKNGPVRAIRRVRQSLDLGRMFPDAPNGRVYTYYYGTFFQTPARFTIPWLALQTLRDFRFESVGELGTHTQGMRYWDAANPGGVAFDGSERPAATDADHDWWVVSGARGACIQALVIPEEWRAWGIKRGIVFTDQAGAAAGSGTEPGAGYTLLRMTELRRAGAYDLGSVFVVLRRPYRPGDETEVLDGFRAPLETEVRTFPALVRQASAAPRE